jgi:hypothetical protein
MLPLQTFEIVDFHEIRYERYANGGSQPRIFLFSTATTTGKTQELVTLKRH